MPDDQAPALTQARIAPLGADRKCASTEALRAPSLTLDEGQYALPWAAEAEISRAMPTDRLFD